MKREIGGAGFTLFEVLIAVAVLGMLLVVLDQGVLFGVRAAATQVRAELRQGDLEAADRALRGLVAAADPGQFPEPATLKGEAAGLTMVTALPPDAAGERVPVEAALVLEGSSLRLRWTRRRHVQAFGPPAPAQDTEVVGGLSGVAFAYWNGTGWVSRWSAERLPRLVRITLRFRDRARHWPPIEVATAREAIEP